MVTATRLPGWGHVLVVVAHPDDESFALGAVIDALVAARATVSVLCLTRGEASTLRGVPGDLAVVRARELERAGAALGVAETMLRDHPDGRLADVPPDRLAAEVEQQARKSDVDGLLVLDPSGVTGHPDHAAATRAALTAAAALGVPVLAWTLPEDVAARLRAETSLPVTGHPPDEVDVVLPVSRTRQRVAVAAHASQALPGSVLWRRLELLGDHEHLRLIGSSPGERLQG